MDALSQLLTTFRLQTDLINNAQYCGSWAVDTSGTGRASFHLVAHSACYLRSAEMAEPTLIRKGDFVLFPRDQKHLLSSAAENAVTVNQQQPVAYEEGLKEDGVGLICGYFHFKQSASSALTQVLPDAIVIHRSEHNSSTTTLIDLMISESLKTTPGTEAAVDRLAEALFVIILREYLMRDVQKQGLAAALRDPRIHNAMANMHAAPDAKWTVEALAKKAAMSRSAFAERFKTLMGESPMEYLTRWRMQLAYNLLAEQGLSILDVAGRCGYESEVAFAKAFKRMIGIGPGAVRQNQGLA